MSTTPTDRGGVVSGRGAQGEAHHEDIVLEFSSEQIKEMLEEGIGMESRAFVIDVLSTLRDDDRNLGSRDVGNFARVIQQFPPVALGCLVRALQMRRWHHLPGGRERSRTLN